MVKHNNPTSLPRFSKGNQVHVKPGTTDPDFPDMPLGGWAGTIHDVEPGNVPPTYLVKWNRQTLQNIHPVFRKRCEIEGFEIEEMWLPETDLELDTGQPVPIEQPTKINTKPLSMNNQDDRLRAIFGLTSNDPIPDVAEEWLLKYHSYLSKHLTFPFEASVSSDCEEFLQDVPQVATVLGLPDTDGIMDEDYGVLCEARYGGELSLLQLGKLETKQAKNHQLLADYAYWFWDFRG